MFDRHPRRCIRSIEVVLVGLLFLISAQPVRAARALETWATPESQEQDPPETPPGEQEEPPAEPTEEEPTEAPAQEEPAQEEPAPEEGAGEQPVEEVAPPERAAEAQPIQVPESAAQEAAESGDREETPEDELALRTQKAEESAAEDAAAERKFQAAEEQYGLWVLAPAGIAILLAILTRQVVISLAIGVLAGAYMMVPLLQVHPSYQQYAEEGGAVVAGFRLFAEVYLVGALSDGDHLMIILFTLTIGFMIGVIGRNGGTAGLVRVAVGRSPTRRKGAVSTWFAGLIVFFDDYANTMIVGPTMRRVFDKVRLSRAKLAYIVDSTAAPVSSIVLIGTWVGAEVGFIRGGFEQLGTDTPQFLEGVGPMDAFISSIPYRYYPILALVLVLIVAWTGRDFGPMRRSEQKAVDGRPPEDDDEFHGRDVETRTQARPRLLLGLLPILVLVFGALAVLWLTGTSSLPGSDAEAIDKAEQAVFEKRLEDPDVSQETLDRIRELRMPPESREGWDYISAVISASDSYLAIFYGAMLSAVLAVFLTVLWRAAKLKEIGEAAVQGMSHMFPALIILVFAWCLSAISEDLALGKIVGQELEAAQAAGWFEPVYLPLAVFICAALISFASGSSWATMGILCPMTVVIAARLAPTIGHEVPAEELEFFYASVGSVLAGAIFGDHCSPISDTTVLSSVSAGVSHEEHVWTQMPYALLTAVVAMGIGDVACRIYDLPWYVGMSAGALVLFLFMLIFGRKPKGLSRLELDPSYTPPVEEEMAI